MSDYYKILNIPRSATEKEIKKAYRKLAIRWHPDKNNSSEAQEKFQEIGEAYGVLSDPEKKQKYDQFGKAGLEGNMGGINPNDLFASMFGGGMFGGGMFGGGFGGGFGGFGMPTTGHSRVNRKGPTKSMDLPISFKEMYTGCQKKFSIARNKKCIDCYASGIKKGCKEIKCDMCRGSGQNVITRRTPMGIMQQITACPKCQGKKTMVREEDKCQICNGQKYLKKKEIIKIDIRPGIIENEKVVLEEMGDESENWTFAGNVEFIIKLKPEKNFRRVRNDIYVKKKILLSEALAGLEISIQHPNGKLIYVKYNEVIRPNTNYILENMGFINNDYIGDMVFEFEIVFPSKLDDKRKEIINKILPRRKIDTPDDSIQTYQLKLAEGYSDLDKEEEDFNNMGGNIECNQQ